MDEVFGVKNHVTTITFTKTSSATAELLGGISDYLIWYAKDVGKLKYRQIYREKEAGGAGAGAYGRIELRNGERLSISKLDQSENVEGRIYRLDNLTSQRPPGDFPVTLDGAEYRPKKGYWKTHAEGFEKLKLARRIETTGPSIYYVRYIDMT